MTWKAFLALAVAGLLAACETYDGPTATCFSLVESADGCEFRAVPGEPQP